MQMLRATPAPPTTVAKRPTANPIGPIVEQMADEMIRRWRQDERPLTEEFLSRLPEPGNQPEAAFELIAEELALRAEFDLATTLEELTARFPLWSDQVAARMQGVFAHKVA